MKLLVAIVLSAVTVPAASPVPLPPIGKWTVEYEEQMCVLSRRFGTATTPVTLAVKPALTEGSGEIFLIFPGKDSRIRQGSGRIVLQPVGRTYAMTYLRAPLDANRYVVEGQPDIGFQTGLSQATSITIDFGEPSSTILALSSAKGAVQALKTCQDDLLRTWGVDPAAMAPMSPDAPSFKWFGPDVYPADALRARKQGRTIAVLTVDRAGRVKDCNPRISAGYPSLDEVTCRLALLRGRFTPAPDGPATRYAVLPVKWTLPVVTR